MSTIAFHFYHVVQFADVYGAKVTLKVVVIFEVPI